MCDGTPLIESGNTALCRDEQETGKKTDRTGRHWRRWEIGQLLELADAGETIEHLASSLNRTPDAIRRELDRLITGEAACPDEYADVLKSLKKKYPPANKPTGSAKPAKPDTTEQYKNVMRNIIDVAKILTDVEKALIYVLALDVVKEQITPAEVIHFCPPPVSRAVGELAARIIEFRAKDKEAPGTVGGVATNERTQPHG